MVSLDKLRITKLKCLSCGCRDKRVSILTHPKTGKRLGFSTTCCNCGETRTYVFRDQKKKFTEQLIDNLDVKSILEKECVVTCIFCAIPEPFCPNKNCPLYRKRCLKDLTFKDLEDMKYDGELIREPEISPIPDSEKGKFI